MDVEQISWHESSIKKVLTLERRTGPLTLETHPRTKVLTLERHAHILLFSELNTHAPFSWGLFLMITTMLSHVMCNPHHLTLMIELLWPPNNYLKLISVEQLIINVLIFLVLTLIVLSEAN